MSFFEILIAIILIVLLVVAFKLGGLTYILTHHRWILVIFFLMPLSILYDAWFYLRAKLVFYFHSAPAKHSQRVAGIVQQVKNWKAKGGNDRMCTARPGWLAMSLRVGRYKSTNTNIHIDLYDILDVDAEKKIVKVEPMVSMGQVTATLLPLGWTLPILPELDDLTVGGLVCGEGVETSSHKYGLFQQIVVSAEIVTADGEVVVCSRDQYPDLFYSLPWTHGSLGFLVSVELQIIPSKSHVRLTYKPFHSREEATSALSTAAKQGADPKSEKYEENDFVEMLAFSESEYVLMIGTLTDNIEKPLENRLSQWYKPWFFTHVQQFLDRKDNKSEYVEYIPLRDYYHRHTKSLFWEMQDIVQFGNNPIFRYLLGWLFHPKMALIKKTQTEEIRELYVKFHVVQDMLVPIPVLNDTLETVHQQFQIYPLWLCPFQLYYQNIYGLIHPTDVSPGKEGSEIFVDVGIYGVPHSPTFHHERSLRAVEQYVRDVHGFQMLYADTLQTREEFRIMFNHQVYDQVRQQYNCIEAFPEVYDKISAAARF